MAPRAHPKVTLEQHLAHYPPHATVLRLHGRDSYVAILIQETVDLLGFRKVAGLVGRGMWKGSFLCDFFLSGPMCAEGMGCVSQPYRLCSRDLLIAFHSSLIGCKLDHHHNFSLLA